MDDDLSFLDNVKSEKAPTTEELISNYPDGNSELTELTTPPKLQNVSPKDQHGTPTHSHKQELGRVFKFFFKCTPKNIKRLQINVLLKHIKNLIFYQNT